MHDASSWIAAGDWNAVPDGITPPSAWIDVFCVRDGSRLAPTRWAERGGETPRCVDYITAFGSQVLDLSFGTAKISDHKVLKFSLAVPRSGFVVEHRAAATRCLSRPAQVPADTWVEFCTQSWNDGTPTRGFVNRSSSHSPASFFSSVTCPHEPGSDRAQEWVDATWDSFQRALEATLASAQDALLATCDVDPGAAAAGSADPSMTARAADYTGQANDPRGKGRRRRPATTGHQEEESKYECKGVLNLKPSPTSSSTSCWKFSCKERKIVNALGRIHIPTTRSPFR